jgi:hypothetical protein
VKKLFFLGACLCLAMALFLVLFGKIKPLGRMLLYEEHKQSENSKFRYGDLFALCGVTSLKERIPYGELDVDTEINDAEILVMGDSFFQSHLDSRIFAKELENETGFKAVELNRYGLQAEYVFRPLALLKKMKFEPGKARVFVLEIVDRELYRYTKCINDEAISITATGMLLKSRHAVQLVFNNEDMASFFRMNKLTGPFYRMVNGFKYKILGRIDSDSVINYPGAPEMLFFRKSVEFNRAVKSRDTIARYADSMARLSRTLKERYGLDFLYVAIPNKHAVYHDHVGDHFPDHRFISRLCGELDRRGIRNIDSHRIFRDRMNSEPEGQLLYYKADTHFNRLGKSLIVEAVAGEIRNIFSESKLK